MWNLETVKPQNLKGQFLFSYLGNWSTGHIYGMPMLHSLFMNASRNVVLLLSTWNPGFKEEVDMNQVGPCENK